eukprot:2285097-Prymnesium_polylepis.2
MRDSYARKERHGALAAPTVVGRRNGFMYYRESQKVPRSMGDGPKERPRTTESEIGLPPRVATMWARRQVESASATWRYAAVHTYSFNLQHSTFHT